MQEAWHTGWTGFKERPQASVGTTYVYCGTMACAVGFLIESISCFTRRPFSSSAG
jgi:hypothetical protein